MSPAVQYILSKLPANIPQDERTDLALWIAEETIEATRTELLVGKITTIPSNLEIIISRLEQNEPIQYIFGHTCWRGLELQVNAHTLIPRPETSELIDIILSDNLQQQLSVIDAGTGSGCIPIALKSERLEWQLSAFDIDPIAIQTAQRNAIANKVSIDFYMADMLQPFSINRSYDILVSNPPYIADSEKESMSDNVLNYEPSTALFVPDDDPLIFYKALLEKRIAKHIYFEINPVFANQLKVLMQSLGYTDIHFIHDSAGHLRFCKAKQHLPEASSPLNSGT